MELLAEEKRVRSWWVFFLWISLGVDWVSFLLSMNASILFPGLLLLSFSSISSWVLYHCAYTKYGSKLLGWSLVTSALACREYSKMISGNDPMYSSGGIPLFLLWVHAIESFIYFFISAKLVTVNKALRKRMAPEQA